MRVAAWCAAAGLALLAGMPAAARVVDVGPGGFTVENMEVVPVPPDQAWAALVDKVGLWWPSAHTWSGKAANLSIQAKAGGCFCEVDGPLQVQHMQVVFVNPGKLLRMAGGLGPLQGMGLHGALDWVFEPVPEGTKLTLRYRVGGYEPAGFEKWAPLVDKVQGMQLGGLATYLREGRK